MPGIVIDYRRFAEIRERHRARAPLGTPPAGPALLDAPDPSAVEADVASADGPVPVAVVERRRRGRRTPAWLGESLWPFPRRP
jgi:hypothetical protein